MKFFKLLFLSSTFYVFVSCGGDGPSEIAPSSQDVASSEIEVATVIPTPIGTATSTVVKTPVRNTTVIPSPTVEVIATVEAISASAEPVTDAAAKVSISPTPMQQQLTWPIDVGTNHFGALGNTLDGVDGGWIRPLPGRFIWGLMEPEKGEYLWTGTDRWVQKWQDNHLGVLVTIWPFAQWDQDGCHNDDPPVANPREFAGLPSGLFVRMYAPCDPESYASWLGAVVERYDGDGIDDMPGLQYPIRHWEIGNEPDMQSSSHTLFQGTSMDYLNLLKLSYETIKSVDTEAKVLIAAPSKFTPEVVDFWEPILEGGSHYFAIGNMHSLQGSDDFHASDYQGFLESSGSKDKPFWITEAGVFMAGQALEQEALSRVTIPNYASAFANGADVVFRLARGHSSGKVLETYLLAARTFGQFNNVFGHSENVVQFDMPDGKTVFVLWDNGLLPKSVTGQVQVITYDGKETVVDAAAVETQVPTLVVIEAGQ